MIKTTISIPEDIYTEAKKTAGNFSLLVSEAIREYLRKRRVNKAVSSFGKWQKRDKESTEIVNELRTLTSTDCLINATAIVKKHKIATRNKEHYPNKKMLWKH